MNLITVVPVIFVIVISAFIVKIAAVALNLTGLDEKRAFFQALSAFTGTGFTTSDSELVVKNPMRRKIIMTLMVLGNAGLVSIISTLTLTFFRGGGVTPFLINLIIILLAILLMIRFSLNKEFTRKLTRKIQHRLMRSNPFTKRPVEQVLKLAEGYGIAEVTLSEECTEIGKSLFESAFRQWDILILAIERSEGVIPAPHASDTLKAGDTLICYGKLHNIENIGVEGNMAS